jgi:hypothetical protein
VILAIPMFALWVIGTPIVAFIALFKMRNKLDDWAIQRYLLVIYQGLKPEVFYWEFVNTARKFMLLSLNAVLFSYSPNYRILIGIGKYFTV